MVPIWTPLPNKLMLVLLYLIVKMPCSDGGKQLTISMNIVILKLEAGSNLDLIVLNEMKIDQSMFYISGHGRDAKKSRKWNSNARTILET